MNIKRLKHKKQPRRPDMDQWQIDYHTYWRSPESGHWLCIDWGISAPTLRECVSKALATDRSFHCFDYSHLGGAM